MATLLVFLAVTLFILEGIKVGHPKVSLGWLGLACYAGAALLGHV